MTSPRHEYPLRCRALQDEQESDTCLGACLRREWKREGEGEGEWEAICNACWIKWTVMEETAEEKTSLKLRLKIGPASSAIQNRYLVLM